MFMAHQEIGQKPAPDVWCPWLIAIGLPPAPVSATWAEGPCLFPTPPPPTQRVVNILNSIPISPMSSLLTVFLPISTQSLKSRLNPLFHSYKPFQAIPEPPISFPCRIPAATGGRQRLWGELNKFNICKPLSTVPDTTVMAIKVLRNKYNKYVYK